MQSTISRQNWSSHTMNCINVRKVLNRGKTSASLSRSPFTICCTHKRISSVLLFFEPSVFLCQPCHLDWIVLLYVGLFAWMARKNIQYRVELAGESHRFFKKRLPIKPEWIEYTSDIYKDVRYKWEWSRDALGEWNLTTPEPHCLIEDGLI